MSTDEPASIIAEELTAASVVTCFDDQLEELAMQVHELSGIATVGRDVASTEGLVKRMRVSIANSCSLLRAVVKLSPRENREVGRRPCLTTRVRLLIRPAIYLGWGEAFRSPRGCYSSQTGLSF